jgi:hypothetical protein
MALEIIRDEIVDLLERFEGPSFEADDAATILPRRSDPTPADSHEHTLAELLGQIRQILDEG